MSSDKPLIGYVVIDEYEEGMGHWGGHIAYPNPEGANLYWESPEPFIQKSYADSLEKQLKAERAKVADLMKALEFYAALNAIKEEYGATAREALAKVRVDKPPTP